VEAYVDDVVVVGEDENDLLIVDAICRQFEAISGAILNRSHKTAILGLGGWAGRKAWPLAWVSAPDQLKTFGVVFAPTLASTVSQSWEGCLGGIQAAIHGWRARGVTFLSERRDVLEMFIFSKLWYLAQILPLPQAVAARATSLAGSFLWAGHLERLAWQELHHRRQAGGLGVSCIFTRGQALLAKQLCHQVAGGGAPAGHLAFWLGAAVGHYVPALAGGSHSPRPPTLLVQVADVLVELFSFGTVAPNRLAEARSAAIYAAFMDTPPPPKVEAKWPLDWAIIWRRLWGSGLPPPLVDKCFRLLHNILPLRGRLASLGATVDGACPHCGEPEEVEHFFQRCQRVADLWDGLYVRLLALVPGFPSDRDLLWLAFPPCPLGTERLVVAHIGLLVAEIWESRSFLRPPSRAELAAAFRVHFPDLRCLF
jgi:hypothetical protein